LYAYRCTQCGYHFEKIQHFSAKQERVCPKCHGVLERPLTAPRLNFKGSGWYVNDYAAKSVAPADSSGSSGESVSAAAETKTSSAKSESTASTPAAAPAAAPAASGTSGTSGS
jgi:putative FmdB family regulatory protein